MIVHLTDGALSVYFRSFRSVTQGGSFFACIAHRLTRLMAQETRLKQDLVAAFAWKRMGHRQDR